MTRIVYQNLDDFMEKLKKLGMETVIYLSTVFSTNASGIMMGSVRCQFHDGFGIFHVYNTTDNIKSIHTVEDDTFSSIPDEELKKKLQNEYLDKLKEVENQTKFEFDKHKKTFADNGFKVVEAYIQ